MTVRWSARRADGLALGLSVVTHLAIALVVLFAVPTKQVRQHRVDYTVSLAVRTERPALLQKSSIPRSTFVAVDGAFGARGSTDTGAVAQQPFTGWQGNTLSSVESLSTSLPELPATVVSWDEPPLGGLALLSPAAGVPQRIFRLSQSAIEAQIARDRQELSRPQPQGEPTTIRLFDGPAATGRSFVFLLDRSASTGPQGFHVLAPARRELRRALDGLDEQQRIAIIAYNETLVYLAGRQLSPVTDELRRAAVSFLDGIVAFGGTDHALALHAALDLQPEVLYVLTDGDSPMTAPAVTQVVQRAVNSRTRIYCLQFGNGPAPADSFLRTLAEQSAGAYAYLDAK
jgi:hypothetical protein